MFLKKMARVCLGLCATSGMVAYGQNLDKELTLRSTAEVQHVENAGQQPSGSTQVSQQEWEGGLIAQGRVDNGWAFFDSDYQLLDRRYSEFDRRNDQLVLGMASLKLGRDDQRVNLELDHSSREMPILPGEGDSPENRDRKTILAGQLNGSLRLGSSNSIKVFGRATDIQLDRVHINESSQLGGGVSFARTLTALSRFGLTYSESELEYRYVDEVLVNRRLTAWWQTQLRSIGYKLEFGSNDIESNMSTTDGPYADFALTYDEGVHRINMAARHWLSDTSQGSGNASQFTRTIGQDGRLGVVDVFTRSDYILSWTHKNPCASCVLKIDLGLEREEYERFTVLSSDETFLRASFVKRLSAGIEFNVQTSFNSVNYSDTAEREAFLREIFGPELEELGDLTDLVGGSYFRDSFQDLRVDVGLTFSRVLRNGEFRTFIGGIRRSYDDGADFHSEYIGLNFKYLLAQF